ncbi:MAG: M28 family peptidase [Phycisphaerales bacterium]|nr:M28 family peptidase [Phycisphaerales bacterium]
MIHTPVVRSSPLRLALLATLTSGACLLGVAPALAQTLPQMTPVAPTAAPSAPAPAEPKPARPAAETPRATPAPATTPSPSASVPSDPRADALSGLLRSFSADEALYTQHLFTLSNPFFEGRAPGTRGNVLAAEYIEFYFRSQLALTPAFPDAPMPPAEGETAETPTPFRSFRQPFQRGTELRVSNEALVLSADGPSAESTFTAGSDFNTLGFSGSGDVSAPLVSAGYAIDAGANGFRSFPEGETDLKGKIVLLFRFEPLNDQGRSRLVDPEQGGFSPAASIAVKIGAVIRRGASGVIIVNPPGVDDPRANVLETAISTQQMMSSQSVPVAMVSEAAGDRLLKSLGSSLMATRKIADEGKQIQTFGERPVRLAASVARVPVMTDNVAGVLRGRGSLADEYVIIGGHYDHLGYGFFGSRAPKPRGIIHNGADDNASGTAGVLLVARQLADAYAALPADREARSIIFIAFSAEESGLHGARQFIRKAPIPADKTYAMLNMDMIGRLRNGKIDIDGFGTATQWPEIVQPLIAKYPLTPKYGKSGRGPSDHAEFFGAGIPVLHFFTGLHAEYHTPQDVYTTTNPLGAVLVTRLVSDVAMDLATREGKLTFQNSRSRSDITGDRDDVEPTPIAPVPDVRPTARPVSPASSSPAPSNPASPAAPADPAAAPRTLDTGAAPEQGPGRAGPMSGMRVRFGIAPGDYSGEDGVVVGDVYPDTSAAEAGLKEGDRMTRWNDKPLKSVEDWMPLLVTHKPGDKVRIVYVRAGKELETTATLKGRQTTRNE